ncbi:glycine cleavage system protein R [Desulfotalea psychrophila]|uniref:ACT domain-containing protein n=1 Tax=Desulfotalea psychrophila (strain LSv54 / DSM 12343) TaxID=177439 RepID=Q6AQ64_DESPS|nr:ACT domain-containing protein [Desulfotalea psychrophila]CAG35509.1 hypothetical protein DP0780 [Desulfotalea psychrophila LSv54]
MKKQMIISVMSKDRSGIVAEVTGAIFSLNGDLADINQSVVCGYFTMIVSATFEGDVSREDILAELYQINTTDRFEVSVKEVAGDIDLAQPEKPTETYVMTVQSPNKKGLVHGVSQFCHAHKMNIIDLSTNLRNGIYTMALQLDLTKSTGINAIEKDLARYNRDSGLQIVLQHNDIFQVTNEVTLR